MLSSQIDYSNEFMETLRGINLFVILIYISYWHNALICCNAPVNNVLLIIALHGFKRLDFNIGASVLKVIKRFLWYLASEPAVFVIFSNKINKSVKQKVVFKLLELNMPLENRYFLNVLLLIHVRGTSYQKDHGCYLVCSVLEWSG